MFVSFLLPSIFEGVEARHLLVFYKQLADFGRDRIAFVGEPAYFRPPSELQSEGRPEWQPSWRSAYEYEPPTSLEGVHCHALDPDLLGPRLSRLGSSWKLYGQVVTRRLPELEAAFETALDRISARHAVEGAIVFANLPSLSHVASKRKLPVIHTEFGPLRKPAYAMTGYWDLSGVTRRSEAARRYRRFRRELLRSPFPLLDREELLDAVRRTHMPSAPAPVDAPFRVGLALQGEENAHVHGVSALDCLSTVRRHFHQRDILVRYHSGGLARYSETLGVADASRDATEFILQCERIVTVSSGVALEALLLGRQCVVLGDSPFGIAADRSLDAVTRRDPDEHQRLLNFLVFGYLVPCPLMFNPDYTRWRLSGPPEADIFRYHQDWYRTQKVEASQAAADPVPMATSLVAGQLSLPQPTSTSDEQTPGAIDAADSRTVLMVYPYCLDQVGHGNIQRVLSIARHLAGSGFDVDLVYQGNPRVAQVADQYTAFRRVYRVEGGALSTDDEACARRVAAFYGAHEAPAAHLRPSAPLTALVRALIEAEPYRAVVATYAWTAPIFTDLARRVPLVCDVQDILHEHAEACHRTTGHLSSFSLPPATEAFLWRQWDLLVAITPEDAARIRRDALPHQHLLSARHAALAMAPAAVPGEDDVALYAGSDNMSNVQAVRWLLERVWPVVLARRPRARLKIAGLICRALPESAREMDGVEILGFRQDLTADVANAGVVVAPYLYGSGLKIKVVEAACSGKAIVTTRAGVAGTGLRHRDAIAVEDRPEDFADALVDLLGNRDRRLDTATSALEQARALYSPDACYGPVVGAIRHLATTVTPRAAGQGFPAAALRRVTTVVEDVRPVRVVLWGNGAHTRSLVAALGTVGVSVDLILDGRAEVPSTSPEGIAVRPGAGFPVTPGDLVVLSSETFENDMWHALATYRAAGGWVLGLWELRRISRSLVERLSPGARAALGVPVVEARGVDAPPAVVLWDSQATAARWWRMAQMQELAEAGTRRGITTVVVTASATDSPRDAGWRPGTAVMPILELDGRAIEQRDPGELTAADTLARAAAAAARVAGDAIGALAPGKDDLFVLMSPTLTECFAVAAALGASGQPGPSIIVHGLAPTSDGPHWVHLSDADRRAYWRLAVGALAEAALGRFTLTTPDAASATELEQFVERPVRAIGTATSVSIPAPLRAPRPSGVRVLCLGHVCSNVRPLLEALLSDPARAAVGPVSVSWRSRGHGHGPAAADRWAVGLATLLGIDLLDDRSPEAMLEEIASAGLVVVADTPRDQWAGAVCLHAAAAGVPVIVPGTSVAARLVDDGLVDGCTFTPGDPQDLVARLVHLAHKYGRRLAHARRPGADVAPLAAAATDVFDRLLSAAGYRLGREGTAGPTDTAHEPLTTEIAHAATN